MYRYESGQTKVKGECRVDGKKIVVKAQGAKRVNVNDPRAVTEALAYQGVLAVSVDATHWKNYASGIMTNCTRAYVPDYGMYEVTTNHAVTLVSYGQANEKLGYWKIQNSWGHSWGIDGMIFLERKLGGQAEGQFIDMSPKDGVACKDDPDTPYVVAGTCGVLSNVWYPFGVEYLP